MRNPRSLFLSFVAMAMAWCGTAGAFDNQKAEAYANPSAIDSSGAILPNTDTVTAETGMPPPLIVASFESNDQAGLASVSMFDTVSQNGHHRSSLVAAPPLINALFSDTAYLISASGNNDLAGGILNYDTSQTADYWSGSGNSADAITPAVDIVPPEIQALKSA